ncbi:tyrosine-type recombinase/integrase [Ornithinibacillus xuwenensis]|uniref:Site-specific integrase n=1 Tax=Ornithinibacillus xuwenensis TaxID=3144668 RepID=A0ABU9XC23_9BACI
MYCRQIRIKSGQVRWECVSDGPPKANGSRNQITRRGKTMKEAKVKVLDEIKRQEHTQIDSKTAKTFSFESVASQWYDLYKLTGIKKGTLAKRRKEIRILNRHLGKFIIGNITHDLYQKVINQLFEHYESTTLQGIHSAGNMIFKFAKKRKWIIENPASEIVMPKKRKTIDEIKQDSIEEKFLDHDELEEFLLAALNYGLKYDKERFYTLAFSGVRPGELCALQKQDILFETNEIDIVKTLYNENNNMREYELIPPKTYKSVRTVAMERYIMDMLKKIILENDKRKMKYRNKQITYFNETLEYHDADFVFSRLNGYPFTTISLNNRMNRLLKKTKIKKPATPHIFRHTHVSMLAEAGVDLATIMKRVGHEDAKTTMKIYTHVTNKMKKEAPVKISNLYGNILEKVSL